MRQRFSFWAVLLILLAASPFTAPFQTCGNMLLPDSIRPTASNADDNFQLGSPLERVVRRVTPLALLPASGVPLAAQPAAFVAPPVARWAPLHALSPSTVLRI
jgi:hypothetical protein